MSMAWNLRGRRDVAGDKAGEVCRDQTKKACKVLLKIKN